MTIELDIKRNINFKQILEIFKFELFLQKKRYLIMLILSLVMYNLSALFLIMMAPPTTLVFVYYAVGQHGSFLLLIVLFFAGGVLADEFDKRTALTNFTKTGRDNFFIGKALAAFMCVIVWIGPVFLETLIFSLMLYGTVAIELFQWFGYFTFSWV